MNSKPNERRAWKGKERETHNQAKTLRWTLHLIGLPCTLCPGHIQCIFHILEFLFTIFTFMYAQMPLLSIQSLVQMSSTHIFLSVSVSTHCVQHSVCSLFISFKKDEDDDDDQNKKVRKQKKFTSERKKRVLSTTNTNSLAVLAVLTVIFILGLFSFRVVLVACFSCSLCYAYPSASSSFSFQFICRLLLFIMQSKLYAHHTTSRHNVRCNIVFIVHILRCELFLFPPIFSMLFRYM